MTNDASDITIVSHKNVAWPGARSLYTQQDGILLGIGHRALFTACERLREEGFKDECMCIVVDADNIIPTQAGRLGNVLA